MLYLSSFYYNVYFTAVHTHGGFGIKTLITIFHYLAVLNCVRLISGRIIGLFVRFAAFVLLRCVVSLSIGDLSFVISSGLEDLIHVLFTTIGNFFLNATFFDCCVTLKNLDCSRTKLTILIAREIVSFHSSVSNIDDSVE